MIVFGIAGNGHSARLLLHDRDAADGISAPFGLDPLRRPAVVLLLAQAGRFESLFGVQHLLFFVAEIPETEIVVAIGRLDDVTP